MVSNVCPARVHNIKTNIYDGIIEATHSLECQNCREWFFQTIQSPTFTNRRTYTTAATKCSTFITVCPSKITPNKLTWFDCRWLLFSSKPQSNFSHRTERLRICFDDRKVKAEICSWNQWRADRILLNNVRLRVMCNEQWIKCGFLINWQHVLVLCALSTAMFSILKLETT